MADHELKTPGWRLPSKPEMGSAGTPGTEDLQVLLRVALESSPDSVMVLDQEGTVIFANRPFAGMTAETILGRSIFDCVPDRCRTTLRNCLTEAVASGRAGRCELTGQAPGGVDLALESRFAPALLSSGVTLVVVNTTDTSDHEPREDRLRASAERFRLLTETIADVIWTMDLEQRITYVSPSIESLTGYSVPEMQGMELRDLLSPESFALARETLLEELRVDRAPDVEPTRTRTLDIKLVRKGGATIWCETKMSFLRDSRGRPTGVLGVARDISSWREAQEALVASEDRLRRAQRLEAVGQLAGGVAHDFNNLLTVIIGNIELMLKELSSDDLLQSQAVEISRAADRAASLTRQLLAFSRKQMMVPKVLSFNTVIEEMATMLRGLIGENIELKLDLYPAIGKVRADPSQIELALVNLAVNARDAMPEGGRMTIETSNAHLDPSRGGTDFTVIEGPYVMLAVSDTGKGIELADQVRIFEPFFTTKEVGKGTGLGLSTVYGIVKQSAGYIWVTSRPGSGSRFEIYLPRIEAEQIATKPKHQSDSRTRGEETVLVVEDESSVRVLTRRILEDSGYRVLEAASGETALEVLRDATTPIDLLLTDVIMPGMSGARLVEKAKALRPKLGIMYISGHSEDILVRHGQSDLTAKLLQKPFTPEALNRMVRKILDDSASRAERWSGRKATFD